jgi:hypothetical protein
MQIFHRSSNAIARASILGAVFLVSALGWAVLELDRTPYITYEKVVRPQPVPFSHEHHVAAMGSIAATVIRRWKIQTMQAFRQQRHA